jgi:hypothetical protein
MIKTLRILPRARRRLPDPPPVRQRPTPFARTVDVQTNGPSVWQTPPASGKDARIFLSRPRIVPGSADFRARFASVCQTPAHPGRTFAILYKTAKF